jgi:hypothetical protein
MKNLIALTLFCVLALCFSNLNCIEVINKSGVSTNISLKVLKAHNLENFQTKRHKDGRDIIDNWQGIPLQKWLLEEGFDDFQSIRFESDDRYMVRIHKAEMDTMPGWIALVQNNAPIDSSEIRIIFPKQRDMFWVRGIARIILEDYRPVPKPHQLFISDIAFAQIPLLTDPAPFKDIKGYNFDTIMEEIFCDNEESVVLVSRDGLRLRLEYPKHLKGAVIEFTKEGNYNLKSPNIPGGMWLKDITYMQSGPFAIIRKDFLSELVALYKLLEWKVPDNLQINIKVNTVTKEIPIYNAEDLSGFNFQQNEWLQLGD